MFSAHESFLLCLSLVCLCGIVALGPGGQLFTLRILKRVVNGSQALFYSVWHVTFHIILMKMTFMIAAFCEL